MGFLFFPMMTMGLRLAALWAAGAPLLHLWLLESSDIPCSEVSLRATNRANWQAVMTFLQVHLVITT